MRDGTTQSSSIDDRGHSWPHGGTSTCLGHSVDAARLTSVGDGGTNLFGVTGSGFNGRSTPTGSLGRSCDP